MSRFQDVKDSFKRRLLSAVRKDLFGHFERTISEYEREIDRNRKLLDLVSNSDFKRRGTVCLADVQPVLVAKEEVPTEQQERSYRPDQADAEPPHIKEEQEELSLIQKQTPDGEDRGGSESEGRSASVRHSQPDTHDKDSDFPEPEREDRDKDGKDPNGKFSCSKCGKTCSQRGNLNIHMRTHTGEKPFSCSLCGKRFTQKVGLHYHMKIHTGEKPFSCSVCGKNFRQKGPLNYHMLTHTGLKPFSCNVCNKNFRWLSQIRVHKCVGESSQRQRDKQKKPLSCSECGETFPNNSLLMIHKRIHKGKKLLSCTVCGLQRPFSSQMEIHMRSHTGERPYSCSICGKKFTQRGIMMQHMAVHSGVKPFSCSDCGRRFFWHFQIKKHKCPGKSHDCGRPEAARNFAPDRLSKPEPSIDTDESVDIEFWKDTRRHQSGFTYQRKNRVQDGNNAGKKTVNCSEDDAKIEPKDDESVDGDKQSGVNYSKHEAASLCAAGCNIDKPFSSSECHKRSEDRYMLQTHMKCHTGEKPFSCLLSDGGFLAKHISIHTGEKLLSCIICEKRLLESERMSHKCVGEFSQLHHGQMEEQFTPHGSFSCSLCGEGFAHKQHLQVHMRIHTGDKPSPHMICHTGEKSLRCSVCETAFTDRDSLIQHMRVHTRQTQFSCWICGKEFAWRRHLTKHMAVHAKSSRLHQNLSGENREDCGGPGPDGDSGPQTHLQPHTSDSSESETDDSDFWKKIRQSQSGSSCIKNEVCESEMGRNSDESFHLQSDDSVDSDFWKESRKPQSRLNSLKHDGVSQSPQSLSQHVADDTGKQREPQQEDPEPPHIKEEQEELWSGQEGGQLQGLEEADITKFTLTPVPVKSEEDDEEKAQWSQLHHSQSVKPETKGEDCGGPGQDRDSGPQTHLQPQTEDTESSGADTDDSDFWKESRHRQSRPDSLTNHSDSGRNRFSCSGVDASQSLEPESDDSVDSDFWKESRKPQLTLSSLTNNEISESDVKYNSLRKPYSCPRCSKRFLYVSHMKTHMRRHTVQGPFFCSVCGQKCLYRSHLKIHMRTHTGEKPFDCPVCGKKYAHKASMQSHMIIHTVEKQYSCDVCDKGFAWYTELKYHQCVGESSYENPAGGGHFSSFKH